MPFLARYPISLFSIRLSMMKYIDSKPHQSTVVTYIPNAAYYPFWNLHIRTIAESYHRKLLLTDFLADTDSNNQLHPATLNRGTYPADLAGKYRSEPAVSSLPFPKTIRLIRHRTKSLRSKQRPHQPSRQSRVRVTAYSINSEQMQRFMTISSASVTRPIRSMTKDLP